MNSRYLLLGSCVFVLLLIGYVLTSGDDQTIEDPDVPDEDNQTVIDFDVPDENTSTSILYDLVDLRGVEHSLSDYRGAPVLVHFMAVGCGGQYSMLNDNLFKQLKIVCDNLCEEERLTIFTILVSTCETTDLSQLYDMYNVTWVMGNDYQDNKLDVLEKFREYEPEDGTIIFLDQELAVKDVKKGGISADDLINEIIQLEG